MIALTDCWTRCPIPAGGGDDDELLAATGFTAALIVGDRDAAARARAMGVNVIAHLAAESPGGLRPMLLRRRLNRWPTHEIRPLSIWSAGLVDQPLSEPPMPISPLDHTPASDLRPFVLPVSSVPKSIDACELVMAQALVEGAGMRTLLGLPPGQSQVGRARRRLAAADRTLGIEALAGPSVCYIESADLVLDVGINPGGSIDALVRSLGVPRVDATNARTPLALATCIRTGLSERLPA